MNFRKKAVAVTILVLILTSVAGLGVLYASSAPPENPHYSYSECTSCHSTQTPGNLSGPSLVDFHANANAHPSSDCIICHGDRSDDSVWDASQSQYFDGPHKTHLTSDKLSFQCTTCHQSVDFREKSASSVRRQVSMVCAQCHSPFSSKMRPEWASQNCTGCHSDWQTQHSGAPYVNNASIGAGDCYSCHGGQSWYLSGRAALRLTLNNIYWASYADYTAGKLSVDYSVANSGSGTANNAAVTHVLASNGVGVQSTLPMDLGSLAEDGSSNLTIAYSVPPGVNSFRSSLYAQAVNDDDETQFWPSAPPAP